MNKLLLSGMLMAAMFASTANAAKLTSGGPESISGWGCATNKGGVTKVVTLGPDQKVHHTGVLKEGDEIVRRVTFSYDFTDAVECGKKHVFIHLKSLNTHEDGVELKTPKFDLKFSLAGGVVGEKTIDIKYVVENIGDWKLTSKFHYEHKFAMKASVH